MTMPLQGVPVAPQISVSPGPSWQLCPVCAGKGTVACGFYRVSPGESFTTADTARDQCRRCGGSGTVVAP